MEAAVTPKARRKRAHNNQETSLTTPNGSVVKYTIDNGLEGGAQTDVEQTTRLAYNRKQKSRALQAHNSSKISLAAQEKVRRPAALPCRPLPMQHLNYSSDVPCR